MRVSAEIDELLQVEKRLVEVALDQLVPALAVILGEVREVGAAAGTRERTAARRASPLLWVRIGFSREQGPGICAGAAKEAQQRRDERREGDQFWNEQSR